MKAVFKLLACVLAVSAVAPALAEDAYPSKPIRIIVPFPPGGGTDIVSRTVAAKLTESWKVPVIVENRAGGNTLIGAEAAAKSAPDGYTLFVPIDSTLAMNQSLYAKLPYDPINSFTPITLAISMPMVLAVHPSVEAHNVKDLIALSKAKGGQLAYAHGALPAQVAGEVFKSSAKVDMLAVPYKGGSPAMIDVVGGTVPVIFDALGPAMSFLKSGKVRPLAVTSRARSPLLPDVPTLAEAGVPGYEAGIWLGLMAPAGTPRPILERLNVEVNKVINTPDIRDVWAKQGAIPMGMSLEQFDRYLRDEIVKWANVVKVSGAKVD